MSTLSWIILLGGTAGILLVSRRSLLQPHSHGFWRTFAWETLLILFVRNMPGWFADPFAPHQLVSWALLLISLALAIAAVRLLRGLGQQDAARRDPALLGMEKTSRLVTVGLYHYIRHPLYSSLLFLGWGMFFKSPSLLDGGLALLCSIFLGFTARIEEGENRAYFGDEYSEYMKHSKMFIPFIF